MSQPENAAMGNTGQCAQLLDGWAGEPLVTTAWLAHNLAAPGLVVLDATIVKEPLGNLQFVRRPARREFEADGHIPGARFADLVHEFSDPLAPLPFTRPTADQVAAAALAHGIGRDSFVVIYDTLDGIWAARLWWVLRAFGHERVAVLDGGFRKWIAEGRARGHGPESAPLAFGPPWQPVEKAGAFVDRNYVLGMIDASREGVLCNALRRPVFTGAELAYARRGRIPSSVSTPYDELVDPQTNALLAPDILRERLAAVLKGPSPIVTYCGGGITAAGLALALVICGADDIAIYDDSLNEWAADPRLPMVVD
jgi:thiosulfate/3-mercaptopyruvate sulfurtransferase